MREDIRLYNYNDGQPLVSRMEQARKYFDEKFSNVHADVDMNKFNEKADEVKSEIIEAIDDAKPCLCNLATKEDICKARCSIINEIDDSKETIIKEIDEKFGDLNEMISQNND